MGLDINHVHVHVSRRDGRHLYMYTSWQSDQEVAVIHQPNAQAINNKECSGLDTIRMQHGTTRKLGRRQPNDQVINKEWCIH